MINPIGKNVRRRLPRQGAAGVDFLSLSVGEGCAAAVGVEGKIEAAAVGKAVGLGKGVAVAEGACFSVGCEVGAEAVWRASFVSSSTLNPSSCISCL
jgi:hypothetical protein